MKRISSWRRVAAVGAAVIALGAGGAGLAVATSGPAASTNAMSPGRGVNEFGMTSAYYDGVPLRFSYTRGFFCDTTVQAASSTHCEAGARYKVAPAKNFDPLYITVPLGFTQSMMMDCPATLVCVDHPGTIDLARLEPALKPLYPNLTDEQLTKALMNAPTPAHDHFITTTNRGKPEWWDVRVIGVTSQSDYQDIIDHGSVAYIQKLIKDKDPNVLGPIPTNLFLYFSVN